MPGFGTTDEIQELRDDIRELGKGNTDLARIVFDLQAKRNEIVAAVFGGKPTDDMSAIPHHAVVSECEIMRREAVRAVTIWNAFVETVGLEGAAKWQRTIDRMIEEAKARDGYFHIALKDLEKPSSDPLPNRQLHLG